MTEIVFIVENADGDRAVVTDLGDDKFVIQATFNTRPNLFVPLEWHEDEHTARFRACELVGVEQDV